MGYGSIKMKISVILTSFNYGEFIEGAIKSILEQSYPKELYEIIVVDACSTDNTKEILNKYKSHLKVLYQKDKSGLAGGCNLGIKASTGEYIVRLDADDLFCKDILLEESRVLDENKKIDFVYTDYFLKKERELKRINLPIFDEEEIFRRGDFSGGGTMYRKGLFHKYGNYDEKFRSIENYEFIIRILKKGIIGQHIKKPLYIYNYHENSMSTNTNLMEEAWRMIETKYGIKCNIGKYHPRNIGI